MFKIEFFVDDKWLAETLTALAGRARNLQVIPVVNAIAKPNGRMRQDAEHTLGLFCKELKKLGEINSNHAKEATRKAGMAPTSYNHFLNQAVKAGLIKKHGKGNATKYDWV